MPGTVSSGDLPMGRAMWSPWSNVLFCEGCGERLVETVVMSSVRLGNLSGKESLLSPRMAAIILSIPTTHPLHITLPLTSTLKSTGLPLHSLLPLTHSHSLLPLTYSPPTPSHSHTLTSTPSLYTLLTFQLLDCPSSPKSLKTRQLLSVETFHWSAEHMQPRPSPGSSIPNWL